MGILKVLLIAVFAFLPLSEIARFTTGNGISFTLVDVTVATLAIAFLLHHPRRTYKDPLLRPILVFITVASLSLLANSRDVLPSEFVVSSLYLVRFAMYAFLYFIVAGFNARLKPTIANVMVLSGAAIVISGYIQYFLYPDLANLRYLGWDEHLYRMFATFLDPNFAGGFFVLELMLTVGAILYCLENKKIRQAQLFGLLGIATFLAVFLTYSRSALLMLFVSATTFLILTGKKRLIIGMLLVSVIVFLFLPKAFQTEGTNLLRSASSQARVESVKNGITIFRDHPVLGVGFNTYRFAQQRYGFLKEGWEQTHAGAGVENSFVFLLATAGMVGFLAYSYLWLAIINQARKVMTSTSRKSLQNMTSIVFLSCASGLFVHALFINSLFYPPFMLWMWVLLALTVRR